MREHFVYRRWGRARRLYFQRYLQWSDSGELADSAALCALILSFLALPLDLTLLGLDWDLWGVRRMAALPALPVALALVGLIAANAIRVDRLLGRWGTQGSPVGWSARGTRMLLFMLPIAWILAVSLWNRAAERWPDPWRPRSLVPARLSLDPGGDGLPRSVPARVDGALLGGAGRGVWFVLEILVVGGSVCWLAGEGTPSPGRRLALVAGAAAMHLMILLGCLVSSHEQVLRLRLAGLRRHLRIWLPMLCLAPAPVGIVPVVVELLGWSSPKGLVWSGHVGLREPDRTAGWREMRRLLRRRYEAGSWWARWTEPSGGSRNPESLLAERRLRELIQAKALLMLADGLVLGWVSVAVTGGLGRHAEGIVPWRTPLVLVPFGLALAGVALAALTYAGTLLRIPGSSALARHPYAASVAWPAWELALGILVGRALAGGAIVGVVALLAYGSVLPLLLSSMAEMLSPVVSGDSPSLRRLLWALTPSLWVIPALAYIRPEPHLRELVTAAVLSVPVVHFLLGLTLGRWLLWPYRLRDLGGRDVPARRRLLLGFLAATVALPGGGLAAPLWVLTRHRLGPDLGRRLAADVA